MGRVRLIVRIGTRALGSFGAEGTPPYRFGACALVVDGDSFAQADGVWPDGRDEPGQ